MKTAVYTNLSQCTSSPSADLADSACRFRSCVLQHTLRSGQKERFYQLYSMYIATDLMYCDCITHLVRLNSSTELFAKIEITASIIAPCQGARHYKAFVVHGYHGSFYFATLQRAAWNFYRGISMPINAWSLLFCRSLRPTLCLAPILAAKFILLVS